MIRVKTFTATSFRVHEPIVDCCTSTTEQKKKLPRYFTRQLTWSDLQYIHARELTVKDIVSGMNFTELFHVFDWVTAGWGGANAGLTGDASKF